MKSLKFTIVTAFLLFLGCTFSASAQSKAEKTSAAHAVYGGNQASTFKAKKKKKTTKRKNGKDKDAINGNRRKTGWAI